MSIYTSLFASGQAEWAHLFLYIHGHLCASPNGRCQEARPESRGQNNEGAPFYFTAQDWLLPFSSCKNVHVCAEVWFVHQARTDVSLGFPAARCVSYVSRVASRMLRVAGPARFPALACTVMSCSVGGARAECRGGRTLDVMRTNSLQQD